MCISFSRRYVRLCCIAEYTHLYAHESFSSLLLLQAVRQTVRIVGMDNPQGVLRTGDRALVEFEFISHPEFVKVGMKLLFREGKTKVNPSRF